jgi:hypothetical protein
MSPLARLGLSIGPGYSGNAGVCQGDTPLLLDDNGRR